ncbi:MAG: hypothetical protein AAF401_14690 [Pseudomonadota bacterium]
MRFCLPAVVAASPLAAAEQRLGEGDWRAMTDGALVYYAQNGQAVGREYYFPGEYHTVYETPDGACHFGAWSFVDDKFCFAYGDSFQCFWHIRRGDALISQSDIDGSEQQVTQIERNASPACAP